MAIDLSFTMLIKALGLIQGLLIGAFLLFTNNQKSKARLFLGLYILFLGIQFGESLLAELHFTDTYPLLLFLPLNSSWLRAALFFNYVQRISIFSSKENGYKFLIPGIIWFVAQTILFLMPIDIKIKLADTRYMNIFSGLGLIYGFSLAIYTLIYIRRHFKEVKNQYSNLANKRLAWAWQFIILSLVPLLILITSLIFNFSHNLHLILGSYALFLLYWISIHGVMQPSIKSLVWEKTYKNEGPSNSNKKSISNASSKNLLEIINLTNSHIISTKSYLNKDLTILEVAQELDLHPRPISAAINAINKENFNSYINRFRINEAIKLLNSGQVGHLTIEGVGSQVGFQSKSAFYGAFKKITGTTPSNYHKNRAQ
ncbi:AraC-like DNA-binding protein [Saonia flava]|uniref:AraC-like DNA-binding protein n=1 Tax=Saonia flava TaxID=523696 RepID=A0A846QUJ1_9FLAO|nr:helix-turn-helix transcriptional regulator [Saonia flava]NJB70620.1 AraC-like DNA-binding protein [Saonia flava]